MLLNEDGRNVADWHSTYPTPTEGDMSSTNLKLALAMASALSFSTIEHRPPQRKVGSSNPNRAAQKAQRKARKKNR